MPASTPAPEAGRRLKAARLRVSLSAREVERLSQRLAIEKSNQEYALSHAWLIEIENGQFTPSIYKLYSLSVIYKRGYDEILSYFDIQIGDLGREQASLSLPHTHLIDPSEPAGRIGIPAEFRTGIQLEKTNLVSRMFHQWGGVPVSLLSKTASRDTLYGYVGTHDFNLIPLIRPGSFVEIDAGQRKIDRNRWSNEAERPIYFVELRDSYACSWCELREGRLLLVPSPQSGNGVRDVRYPRDAGIVGRVIAVSMRIAESI